MNKRLMKDFNVYLNVIGKCGGGIKMEDLPFLINLEYKDLIEKEEMKEYKYGKVTADIRAIEKLIEEGKVKEIETYISEVKNNYGKPSNNKYITLTPRGWYKFEDKSRGEIKIESNSTQDRIKFNALKKIVLKDKYNTHLDFKEELLKGYKYLQQVYADERFAPHMKGKVEVDKFLEKDDFLIGDRKLLEEQKVYFVKILYIRPRFGKKHFCQTIDKVLSIFEREKSLGNINKDYKIEIEVDVINKIPILVPDMVEFFDKYKREYAYYSAYSQSGNNGEDRSKLGAYRNDKTIKCFNFYTVTNDYELNLYQN